MGFFDKLKAACGVPNYEDYLKEFQKNNPDKTPLSKEEFLKEQKEKMNQSC
ncbi:CstA-like transporter-associated (seleno)protein [Campylobacter canadensis]|uniref:Selenoprotein n=1 Tax=Campylobacter canadensis TaxID=449520 RepID=A0ABS7WRB1_9BACT|nr:CstA-like transporter-associated (seleno)protein [Campylobacter canadensis]MBZ7986614.1 putative selenoprotein [Campylobacter canadensis]MBZ7993981.1 putative selenoprotein [Campylobacter canadensis]MBZ7996297.1 putative selenoprotein [Campylobacter canadensis]MBZ7997650.1 putative selenoprotein [Campylobacter canadensis]MBZ7999313.1 putative selenoprotein [Campylobacter canadensis]